MTQITVYVPSTEYNTPVPEEVFSQRIARVSGTLSVLYGGSTTLRGTGSYVADSGETITEEIALVFSFVPENGETESIRGLARLWATEWEQESILIVYDSSPVPSFIGAKQDD